MEVVPEHRHDNVGRAERLGTALLRAALPWLALGALPAAVVRTLMDPSWLSGFGAGTAGVVAAVLTWWRTRGPG